MSPLGVTVAGCLALSAGSAWGGPITPESGGGSRNAEDIDAPYVATGLAGCGEGIQVSPIRNGGFSGAIMPANIVTGHQATLVAQFVAKYSGREQGSEDVYDSGEQAP